ncbi:hypothetical protein [uncultured Fibrobacter sp.]|uniref:hypothetical protein n=1 Tax=uncultured Fibrobacter sp. TaxID=261512 RepID=UPI00259A37AD|nr:hypothetical protein [uncultured Fibrobacter sp.]
MQTFKIGFRINMGIQLGNFNEAQQRRQLLNYYESRRERIFSERNWFQKNTGVCLNVKKQKSFSSSQTVL